MTTTYGPNPMAQYRGRCVRALALGALNSAEPHRRTRSGSGRSITGAILDQMTDEEVARGLAIVRAEGRLPPWADASPPPADEPAAINAASPQGDVPTDTSVRQKLAEMQQWIADAPARAEAAQRERQRSIDEADEAERSRRWSTGRVHLHAAQTAIGRDDFANAHRHLQRAHGILPFPECATVGEALTALERRDFRALDNRMAAAMRV